MKKIFEIKSSKIFFTLIFTFILFPLISLAADPTQNFKVFANNFTDNVLTTLGTVLMTAAFMFFFYGVVVFIYGRVTQKGDLKDLEKGREFMLWGLIALFVMVSAWGIVRVAQDLLDIDGGAIDIKPVQFSAPYNTGTGQKKEDLLVNKYKSCIGIKGGDECGAGLICQGLSGSAKEGEKGVCVTKEYIDNPNGSPLQVATGGTGGIAENPFANTALFPIIKVGAKSDLKAGSGDAFPLLISLLKKKNCTEAYYKNVKYAIGSTFGTTYDEADPEFVKVFQKVNGLSVDGIVGKGTWEALSGEAGQKTVFTNIIVKNCK